MKVITWTLSRDEAEVIWDILMGVDDNELNGDYVESTADRLAHELAETCGFNHDQAVSIGTKVYDD